MDIDIDRHIDIDSITESQELGSLRSHLRHVAAAEAHLRRSTHST